MARFFLKLLSVFLLLSCSDTTETQKTELITEKILTREKDSGTFNTLQSFLDDTKLAYEPSMTVVGSNETIKQAVISNLGIAMISEHCCYNELKNNLLCKLNVDGLPIIKKWYATKIKTRQLSYASNLLYDYILKKANKLGNKCENGKLMFIYQAFSAFKLWHGIEPSINNETMRLLD